MPKKLSLNAYVDEAVESILNGNSGYIVEEIDRLPKKQAMCVVGYIINRLSDANVGSFLRRLENQADLA